MDNYKAILLHDHLRKTNPGLISKEKTLQPLLKRNVDPKEVWYHALDIPLPESNYYRDLFKNKIKPSPKECKTLLNTIHGVKGGEADNVVLILDLTTNVYKNANSCQDQLDAELRCIYVGITRAKKNLHLVHTSSKFGYEEIIRSEA
jgi:hypothetical protein